MDDLFKIDLAEFSLFKFFGMVVFGVLLYIVFWIIQHYLIHLIIKSPVRKKRITSVLPAIFTLLWGVYGIYVIYFLIKPFPLYGTVISLVFVYLGRGYLRNLVNGLFFRLKGNIVTGQKITVNDYHGVVSSLNAFDLNLETKDGERIIIPYATIAKQEIILKNVSVDFCSHTFSIITEDKISSQFIKNAILKSPWISSNIEPKISKTRLDNNKLKFNILVYTLDEKYNYYVENDLRNTL